MNVPKVDIKQLLEAGVHLGHKTLRWNPKMKKYIFGEKNSIHIIDLTQTVDFLKNALVQVHKVIASGGKLLVVSKRTWTLQGRCLKTASRKCSFSLHPRSVHRLQDLTLNT